MSRLLARLQRQKLEAEQRRLVDEALLTADRRHVDPRTAEGDPERLRGIPVIGRGVGGAIPGTRPDLAVLRRPPGQVPSDERPRHGCHRPGHGHR